MADMRLIVAGAGGRMGRTLTRVIAETPGAVLTGALEAPGSELLGQDAGVLAGLPANGIKVSADLWSLSAEADGILDFTVPRATIANVAIAAERGEPIYQHDLILLGLGDDGHTASLFPATAALEEITRRVVANFVPKLNAWRLTFTFPLINQARHILFLVGASKSPRLIERVLAGDQQFPAARVNPSAGEVTWMIGE